MKILIIQNRKGIGDMVIFLPFIEAIAKKYILEAVMFLMLSTTLRKRNETNGSMSFRRSRPFENMIKQSFSGDTSFQKAFSWKK